MKETCAGVGVWVGDQVVTNPLASNQVGWKT